MRRDRRAETLAALTSSTCLPDAAPARPVTKVITRVQRDCGCSRVINQDINYSKIPGISAQNEHMRNHRDTLQS